MKYILVSVLIVILCGISFLVGAKYGGTAFVQVDAKFRAVDAVAKLRSLDRGKIDHVKWLLQSDLDHFFLLHIEGESNPLTKLWDESDDSWLWKDIKGTPLQYAAVYRKEHPRQFSEPTTTLSLDSELRKKRNQIATLVEKYAQ